MRRFIVLSLFLPLACGSIPTPDAGVMVDAGRPPRFDGGIVGSGTDGGMCLRCSLVLNFISGGLGPPMMGGGDPCSMPAMMPPGGFTFCDPQAFNNLMACMMGSCSDACSLGGAMMCMADGGMPLDAGRPATADAGLTCDACLKARCPPVVAACEADQ